MLYGIASASIVNSMVRIILVLGLGTGVKYFAPSVVVVASVHYCRSPESANKCNKQLQKMVDLYY